MFKTLFYESDIPGKLCARRVLGTIGFISCIVALFNPGVDSSQFNTLLYVSAGLLGSTTLDRVLVNSNGYAKQ